MDFLERLIDSLPGYPPDVFEHGTSLSARINSASAQESLADAYRTVVAAGAKPVSGHHSSQGFENDAIAAAAKVLNIPVDSQNGATDSDMVTVNGEFDDPERRTPMALTNDGDLIYLLGRLPQDLDTPPDFKNEKLIGEIMIAASRDGLLNAAHAVTEGGFLVALAQMAMLEGKGARFWIPDGVTIDRALFSSAPGRIICVVPRSEELRFSDMCIARYVPLHRIGVVDGDVLELQDHFTYPVSQLPISDEDQ